MYRSLAADSSWQLKVFFASSTGLQKQWDPNFGLELKWEGITLEFPHTFMNDKRALPSGPKIDAPELEARLDEYTPDVLIVYGYAQKLQRRAIRWARVNARTILMISDSETRHAESAVKRVLKRAVLPLVYRQVRAFLAVGDANEDYYLRYGANAQQLYRCPFPIDTDYYEPFFRRKLEARRECRRALGIAPESFVCLTVGKLVPWKRQADLISAVGVLQEQGREAVALVAGSGADATRLHEAARRLRPDAVIFAGFVQPNELPPLYAAADVYVHASSYEPHSLAVSEAVYMGCPVIVSDACGSYGPSDDVRPGCNGFIYPCGDAHALAERVWRLASDAALARSFGEASRLHAVAAQDLAHGRGLRIALTDMGFL